QLSLAAAAYMLLGVGVGALARSPFVAIGVVLGYFLFVEYVLMMVPGVNVIYPFLPGGTAQPRRCRLHAARSGGRRVGPFTLRRDRRRARL
ncbi:hypothetical protein CTI14_64510, partial [Methylobacterium radiotolerans]